MVDFISALLWVWGDVLPQVEECLEYLEVLFMSAGRVEEKINRWIYH